MELTLVPAYCRDYKTAAECIKDWEAGKDFQIATPLSKDCGRYTSIRDLATFPGEHVKIRFKEKTEAILVRISDGKITTDDDLEPWQVAYMEYAGIPRDSEVTWDNRDIELFHQGYDYGRADGMERRENPKES